MRTWVAVVSWRYNIFTTTPWAKPGFRMPTLSSRVADPRKLRSSCSPNGPRDCADATGATRE
eukprot:793980-Alexandrium_andersonii.AAC.1